MLDQRKWELPSRQSFWCPTSWMFSQIDGVFLEAENSAIYGVPEITCLLFLTKFWGSFRFPVWKEETPIHCSNKHLEILTVIKTSFTIRNELKWIESSALGQKILRFEVQRWENLGTFKRCIDWTENHTSFGDTSTIDIKARLLWIILPELGKIEARHIIPICILWPPYCKHKQKKAFSLFVFQLCHGPSV